MRVIYEDRRAAMFKASECSPVIDAEAVQAHDMWVHQHHRAAAKSHQPAIIEVW